jgi:pseudouridylate synthase
MIESFYLSTGAATAIRRSDPVVVLESTVWIHGLPPDVSVNVLVDCCKIIETEGAFPLVVALSRGRIIAGAGPGDIKAMIARGRCRKVNVRDIPSVIQKQQDGATTVSATIFIADALGLPVVATGGIGGVHRRAEATFDISADIHALATHPLALVSSGVKSILNVGATLEMLETLGVPVLGYKTDWFPSFYCRNSQFPIPERVDSIEAIAEIIKINKSLGGKGVLITSPIPEQDSLSESLIEEITEKVLMEAQDLNITGKELTPFLLDRLHQCSGGQTVAANISLLKENVKLAAQLSRHVFY